MKKLFISSLIAILSFGAVAGAATHTQILLTKDATNKEGYAYLASPFARWCQGLNTVISYGSYESAQYVEALADGFYVCEGKFVSGGQFNSSVQIFEITSCAHADAEVLKGQCPEPRP